MTKLSKKDLYKEIINIFYQYAFNDINVCVSYKTTMINLEMIKSYFKREYNKNISVDKLETIIDDYLGIGKLGGCVNKTKVRYYYKLLKTK